MALYPGGNTTNTTLTFDTYRYGDVVVRSNPPTPALGKITARTVQTKAGWVGQIVIDDAIAWESKGFDEHDDARDAATEQVRVGLARIFS